MTESAFPFDAPDAEPEADAGSKRKLALVAGAGVLAVAVLGYFVVLPAFGGGGDSSSTAIVVHHHAKTKTKAAAAKPAAKPVATQPKTYADVAARTDPFAPLVRPPVEAAPGAVSAPSTTTTGTTSGTTSGTPTGTKPGSSTTVAGQRVALVKVFVKDGKTYAQTKVGDTVYTPAVGTVFAGSYKLLATGTKSATYLFGDEQFSLSEGQEVLK
jgi:hypothetical protein